MASNGQAGQAGDFQAVKARLEEIARAVEDDNLPLDEALDLYEEAVKLGLEASSLLEVGIKPEEQPADAPSAAEGGASAPSADAVSESVQG